MSPWIYNPHVGGRIIPPLARMRTEQRIRRYAEAHYGGQFSRLDIRFHGQFCYIDAYTEPAPLPGDWPPGDWPETREEYLERLRSTPTKLCRLRYFGGEDRWGFAFYTYSNERYELSVFPSGGFLGPPEEAFGVAAGAYLR